MDEDRQELMDKRINALLMRFMAHRFAEMTEIDVLVEFSEYVANVRKDEHFYAVAALIRNAQDALNEAFRFAYDHKISGVVLTNEEHAECKKRITAITAHYRNSDAD